MTVTAQDTQLHTHINEKKRVPGVKFSTEAFRPHEQFDAWCTFTTTMCDLESVGPTKDGFIASAEAYQLDSTLMTSFQLSPMKFNFTKEIVRKSSFDHWCLSVVTKGTAVSESESTAFRAARGEAVLHSYAIPFSGAMDGTDYSCLFFSRDDYWDIADQLDKNSHLRLNGPMAHILSDFVYSLKDRVSGLNITEASAVNDAFGHLIRAMVLQNSDSLEAAKAPILAAQFDRARRYICDNLKSPNLTPESICTQLGISRRQLYYLFERQGGVANFIKNRRLAACYNALTKSSEKKLISSIAYEFGFTNTTTFCRQFQSRYGFSPSEARAAWLTKQATPIEEGGTLVDWLLATNGQALSA